MLALLSRTRKLLTLSRAPADKAESEAKEIR
jgi:hypothetical protein